MQLVESQTGPANAESGREDFNPIELDLALDMTDPIDTDFSTCVQTAANRIGGELLFEVPNDGSIDDAARIAAVTTGSGGERPIAFVVLSADGVSMRVAEEESVDERFYGFAHAFMGVLGRIRTDHPILGALAAEGSA